MTNETPTDFLLASLRGGDGDAFGELLEHLDQDLRKKAAFFLSGESRADTLQPTALVNEAFLRLRGSSKMDWKTRAHFLAAAANTMQRILIDHVRRKTALKRGSQDADLRLDDMSAEPSRDRVDLDLLMLSEALDKLSRISSRQAEVARYYGLAGMKHREIAAVLNIDERTSKKHWFNARIFLERELRRTVS